jgi:ligand-binding sensor domain-containing protein
LLTFFGCEKKESEQKEFKLGTLQKILDGYAVTAISFDSKGNAWIGTQGQGLICYNTNETIVYNSENSILPENFMIWDIAVDKNDNVWIGADGAWKYDGTNFTLYNSHNTMIPEDVIRFIAVDSQNNIWMASCRFQQGGLVKYDGTKWTVYTPNNSSLPGSLINGIEIDKSDNVWVALGEYVNQAYLMKISKDEWTIYYENNLGFKPYSIGGIQFDSSGRLWGAIDYSSLSGWSSPPSPHFFIFDGNNSTLLSCGNNLSITQSRVTIDRNDYVWCFGVTSVCGVWINEQWTQFDQYEFGGSSVWMIEEDSLHRIWFGTENGIYIRKNT